jgi:hypothetical protein
LTVDSAFVAAAETEAAAEPKSFQEAKQSSDSAKWDDAMKRELDALKSKDTYELVVAPTGAKVLRSMWVYKHKKDASGKIVRYKARLVVKGFAQEAGLDYNETFAPVAMTKTILQLLTIAAVNGWYLENMDVDNAFVQSDLEEVVYVQQPDGDVQKLPGGQRLVWRLKKSLYGLKQSPRNRNQLIHKWFESYGLKQSDADPCMYIKKEGADILVVVLYVDDLMIAGNNKKMIDAFKEEISNRFKMKDLGELRWMLGMEIIRNKEERTIEVSQSAYIEQILERFGMSDCKAAHTPMVKPLTRGQPRPGPYDFKYAQMVGSMMYAGIITRPDIMFAIQSLARHMQATTKEHHTAAKHLLRYLKGTKDKGIKLGGTDSLELIGYCDSDFASDVDKRRSTTGYVFMLGGGAVSWSSKLQPTVALSTAEAEYMAMCSAVQEAIYLRRSLKDLGIEQKKATVIHEDNTACIAMCHNPVNHQRTKHIDIRYHFTRLKVLEGVVKIKYVPTEYQLADILTKPLKKNQISYLRELILGYKRDENIDV